MTAAAGSRRCSSSNFSRACGARALCALGRQCRERAYGAPASKKALFPVREHATEGSPGDKKILLHQSTALDELYPTVPLSQIVTRGKYFISKISLYVSCTNTLIHTTRPTYWHETVRARRHHTHHASHSSHSAAHTHLVPHVQGVPHLTALTAHPRPAQRVSSTQYTHQTSDRQQQSILPYLPWCLPLHSTSVEGWGPYAQLASTPEPIK